MSIKRPRSYSGDLITSIVSSDSSAMPSSTYRKTAITYKRKGFGKKDRLPPKTRVAVRAVVNRELNRRVEVKQSIAQFSSLYLTGGLVDTTLNAQSLIPYANIALGNQQGQRIGNKIRTRKVILKYVLRPMPFDGTNNRFPQQYDVMIMIGKLKENKIIPPTSTALTLIWQDGNTSHTWWNDLRDMVATPNRDKFTVYKMIKHKIGWAAVQGQTFDTFVPDKQYHANNDYKLNVIRELDVTQYAPKMMLFNDATTIPTNDGLHMWAFAVPADGSQATEARPIAMTWATHYYYEDM